MCVTALSEDSRTPVTGIYLTGNDVAVEDDVWAVDVTTLRPDIHHPATRGWLLAMLREATGCVDLAVVQDGDTWETMPMYGDCYATEGDALAAALLAVWGAS